MSEPIRWVEPTSLLPLRWGYFRSRVLGGLLLVVAGGVAIAGGSATSEFANGLLFAGSAAHVAGWSIIPSRGWRRVVAMCLSTPAMWFLLTGPRWLGILALAYIGWLLVRHRPVAAYVTVVFPIAAAGMVASRAPEYSDMLLALGIEGGVLVLSAWMARMLHVSQWTAREHRRLRRRYRDSASGESQPTDG